MRRISIVILFIILTGITASVSAKEVKLSVSETKERTVSNFTVPIPLLGDFEVYIKLRTETHGDLSVDLSVNKRTISPGEELEIYVKPISGRLEIKRTPIVEVIDPNGEIRRKELPSTTDVKDLPGEFDVSIPLPISDILKAIIAYYTGGSAALVPIPQIGANVYGKVKTYPKLYVKVMGCYPELTEVTLYSSNPETVRVKKIEGVGAEVFLDSWNLNSVIEVSSDIYGGEYKGNISPVTYKLVDKKLKVNSEIAVLKTPVRIKLNEIGKTEVSEKTLITGFVEPKASIDLKILCDNNVIATIRSSSDGKFDYIWIPEEEGKHFIKVVHDGSDFTMPAESNIVTVEVKPAPTSHKTETPVRTPEKGAPGFEFIAVLISCITALALRRRF